MPRKKSKLLISNVDGLHLVSSAQLHATTSTGFNMFPLDILFEICSCLEPIDLLRLSRTTQSIRRFVLNRSNAVMWRAAFANNLTAGGPPGCPTYLTEPAWTHVAFEKSCQTCQVNLRDDPRVDSVWWEFGGRYCGACLKTATSNGISSKLRGLSLGHSLGCCLSARTTRLEYSSRGWYYLAAHQRELLDQLLVTQDETARRNIIQLRTTETSRIMEHAKLCREWGKQQIVKRQAEDRLKAIAKAEKADAKKKANLEEIAKRLNARGWADEAWMVGGKLLRQLETYPETATAKRGTARGSREFDDTLVVRMTSDKRKSILTVRLNSFRGLYPSIISPHELAALNLTIVPRPIDIALIPQVLLRPALPELLQTWATDALVQISQQARECLGLPDSSNPLDLAISIISCPASCTSTKTHFDKLLKHTCIRAQSQWSNPISYSYGTPSDDDYRTTAVAVHWSSPFEPSRFQFQSGVVVEGLKNVVRAYGLSPESATVKEMDKDKRFVRCATCEEKNQSVRPSHRRYLDTRAMNWLTAMQHCVKSHLEDSDAINWNLCK
ncbi:hypothetical protein C8F01DRAFT_1242559 [Mycena amicta]|nr:hypothetical protein C8F01DRAFT_1242559 [Mycena amicta]